VSEEIVRITTVVLGLAMLIGSLVFVVLYVAEANWQHTTLGRHMLFFMVALSGVLAIRACRFLWPGTTAFVYIGLAAYAMLAVVIWQRVYLLVRSLRDRRSE
jgi:hypothetical protein